MTRLYPLNFAVGSLASLLVFFGVLAVPSAAFAQGETIEYYGTDAIGSIRIVWDVNGNMTARQDFTPFGEPVLQQGTAIPKEGFVGNETDAETNQDYFHARMFEARTGRFTRTDPIEDGVAEPQKWNRYSYAQNNPLRFSDSFGLDDGCTGDQSGNQTCNVTVIGSNSGNFTGSIIEDPPSTGDPDCTSLPTSLPGYRSFSDCGTQVPAPVTDDDQQQQQKKDQQQQQKKDKTPAKPKPQPCAPSGTAPGPLFYAEAARDTSGDIARTASLYQFKRGGPLDAQVRYHGSQAYANYVFGVYMASAGFSLSYSLTSANRYGMLMSHYVASQTTFDPTYKNIPIDNVSNITRGFNDFQAGTLCTVKVDK